MDGGGATLEISYEAVSLDENFYFLSQVKFSSACSDINICTFSINFYYQGGIYITLEHLI